MHVAALLLPLALALPQAPGSDGHAQRRAAYEAMLARKALPALPDAGTPPALDVDAVLREGVGLNALDGALWGVGPGYLARVDGQGLRLTPLAPSDADDAFRFRLEAVERGGAELELDPAPRFEARGLVAAVRHGAALEERYEMRRDGVEQSFLLHDLPEGDGDLVLRGLVGGALGAGVGTHADGLALARDGAPRFRVGDVLAIDADGRTADGALRWDGQALELVVPGDFVAAARLPLLVDPLIQVEWLVAVPAAGIDVAYDADTDLWIGVWRVDEGVPTLLGQRYDSFGNPVGFPIVVGAPDEEAGPPSICNLNAGNVFPVVYNAREPGGGVRVRTIDAATGAVSGHATSPLSEFLFTVEPQIGGDPVEPYDRALVFWQAQDADLLYHGVYQLVECQPAATPAFVGAPTLTDPGSVDGALGLANLRVTKANGPPGVWLLTFDRLTGITPFVEQWNEVVARAVDFNGSTCEDVTIGDGSFDASNASAAGDGQRFVIAYERVAESGEDLHAVCVDFAACGLSVSGPSLSLRPDALLSSFNPAVAAVEGGYVVAWIRSDGRLESVRMNASTCELCGPHVILSDHAGYWVGPGPGRVRMASRYEASFATSDDQALVGWEVNSAASSDSVRAAFVEAVEDGEVVALGGGCGEVGPKLAAVGDPVLGVDLDLVLSEVPDGAFSAVLMVSHTPDLIDLGGCKVLFPNFTIPFAVDPPELVLDVPLPCDGDFVGVTWRLQFVVVGAPGEPIAGLPGVTLSDALELTFGG